MTGPIVVSIKGYNRVRNNLRRLASDMEKELDPVVEAWSKRTRAELKGTPYPPKRPGQRYVRTGQLANRWAVKKIKASRYEIVNFARNPKTGQMYAFRVVGAADGSGQAWMHRGRWWKTSDEIRKKTPALREAMKKKIEAIWNSGNEND